MQSFEAMSVPPLDPQINAKVSKTEPEEGNVVTNGDTNGQQLQKDEVEFEAPSHKYQSRIGHLDKDLEWISNIQHEALMRRPKPEGEKEFILKINSMVKPAAMTIISPYIRRVFAEVVKYYPGVEVNFDSIELSAPYPPLYHYFKEMQEYVRNDKSEDAKPEDFAVLEWYHDNHLNIMYTEIRSYIKLGKISFPYLWAIFRPRDLVLTRDRLGLAQLHVVTSAEFKAKRGNNQYAPLPLEEKPTEKSLFLKAWCMIWSPSAGLFKCSIWTFGIPHFSGSKEITSLEIYPFEFETVERQASLKEELIKRGHSWKRLVSQRPTCWQYQGAAFDKSAVDGRGPPPPPGSNDGSMMKAININERVIVDQNEELEVRSTIVAARGHRSEITASTNDRPEFGTHSNHSPALDFSPFQAMLCPAVISCFCLETERWRVVSVGNLKKVEWNKAALGQLVLPKQTKTLLSGLIQQHAAGLRGTSDFIKNKGKGLTFVLYGPSGVGKSFTAESLAESNELPLRPINISNLVAGSPPGVGNTSLPQIFEEAKRWDAILLIDEADVVLEKRALEDVRRNAIVSAFLRELEYFSGILFLTTNRIETMDRAFQSRIQIAVEYKPLGKSSRGRIWEAFIKTLPSQDERDELEPEVEEWKTKPLNGRQIRNVMNLARSLALNDRSSGHSLKSEHVEQAINETLKFQELFLKWENEPSRMVGKTITKRGKRKTEVSNSDDDDEDD